MSGTQCHTSLNIKILHTAETGDNTEATFSVWFFVIRLAVCGVLGPAKIALLQHMRP